MYITLIARLLNPDLFIVARAEAELAEQNIAPEPADLFTLALSGFKMAQAVLQPNVVDFLELATQTEHLDLQIEETLVDGGSRLAGQTLRRIAASINWASSLWPSRKRTVSCSPIRKGTPSCRQGDTLIAIGHRQQLDQLEKLTRIGKA